MTTNQSQDLHLLRQGLNKAAPIATAISGGLVWAYLMGWCYYYIYFTGFGAAWLIDQIPPSRLLFSSWLPILLAAIGAVSMASMIHDEPIPKFNRIRYKWAVGIAGALYVAALAILLPLFFKAPTPASAMAVMISGEIFLLIVCAILFLAISNKLSGWNAPTAGLLLLILMITIVHIPMAKGVQDGLRGTASDSGDPPIVSLKNDIGGATMRLLLHANGLFYVAKMNPRPLHPEVLIFTAQDIASISGYPAPAAPK